MQACRKNCTVLKLNILPRTVYRCVILHWFAANIDQYTQGTNEVSRLVAVLLQYFLHFVNMYLQARNLYYNGGDVIQHGWV